MISDCKKFIDSWNQFWFAESSSAAPYWTRAYLGIASALTLALHALYSPAWFGPEGWLSPEAGRHVIGVDVYGTGAEYRWSLFYVMPDWIGPLCWVGFAASLLMIAGRFARIGALIAVVILAMLHHRAPLMVGRGEPLLVAALLYSLLIPSLPLERLWRSKDENNSIEPSWRVNFAHRLTQVHFALWILFSLVSMLGNDGWWTGESVRQLLADRQGWLPDLLATHTNAERLTHATVGVHLLLLLGILSPAIRFAGPILMGMLAVAILLVIGDWGYLAILTAAATSVWPLAIAKE